eukprot:263804_1
MSHDYTKLIKEVDHIYSGSEGAFWELLAGRFLHIGGWNSSVDLASKACIKPHMIGVDLCSNSGESSRFLVRNHGVRKMHAVDMCRPAVERGRKMNEEEGFHPDQIINVQADVTKGLPMFANETFDFVWSEDAWCYVPDKGALIKSAERILKPGGLIAFTDWILGPTPMSEHEYVNFLKFMTFPNQETVESYVQKMSDVGITILHAHDTERFTPWAKLCIDMMEKQLQGDVLRIFGNNYNEYDQTIKSFYTMLKLSDLETSTRNNNCYISWLVRKGAEPHE